MNTLIYSGRVDGKMVANSKSDGEHFEGTIGDLPIWLFGRVGQAAGENIGNNVLLTGVIGSRPTQKGNHFISPTVFRLLPAPGVDRQNLIAFTGTIVGTKRIKEGLYQAQVEIPAKEWDAKKKKQVETTNIIPVTTNNLADSDIGKEVSVIGTIQVRNGKFIDIDVQSFLVEGAEIDEDAAGDLDDLL